MFPRAVPFPTVNFPLHQRRKVMLGLTLLIAIVFGRAVTHEFIDFDDLKYVVDNPHVRTGLTWENIRWAFNVGYASNWHPLTWLSLQLDCQLFGAKPGPMIAENILLHALSAILLLHVLLLITGDKSRSFFVTLLFALHPLRVESVVWVAERKDTLSTLLGLGAIWAYAHYARTPSLWRYLLVMLGMTASLLAKPMLVTLPALLLLLDYWPLRRFGPDRSWRDFGACVLEKIPLGLLSLGSAWITMQAQKTAMIDAGGLVFSQRLGNACLAIVNYLYMTILPVNLAVFYPLNSDVPTWKPVLAGAFIAIITLSVFAFGMRKRSNHSFEPVALGWAWFLIALLPVLGLVQVGGQAMADRYTYVPHIGLFIALVWLVPTTWFAERHEKHLVRVSAVMCVVLGMTSHWQVAHWENSTALWQHALRVTDRNYLAAANLGRLHAEKQQWSEAVRYYELASQWMPGQASTWSNMGIALMELQRTNEAVAAFAKAAQLRPDIAMFQRNLGLALQTIGQHESSLVHFNKALTLEPRDVVAQVGRAQCLAAVGRTSDAIEQLQNTLKSHPHHAEARSELKRLQSVR